MRSLKDIFDSYLLGLIYEEPRTGYDIIKIISEKTVSWRPSCSVIYPILKTLEAESLIHSSMNKNKKYIP